MRIAIDAHAIGSRLTGNERYIENLADQLLRLDTENEYFFFFTREEARQRWANRAGNLHTRMVSANPFLRLALDFTRELRAIRPDIFHYQYTGPLFQLAPEIATVHDMSFERYPQFYSASQRIRLHITVHRAARTARKVIVGSEFSKREIVHYVGIPEDRVAVTSYGVGPEFRPIDDTERIQRTLQRHAIRQPYLLTVGNISRRKNHRAAVAGFGAWCSRRPDSEHRLVLAGQPQDAAQDVFAEARKRGVEDRLNVLGFVPEEDLPCLYAGAAALLYTSIYEGFGLPLVEAMQCGIPVIASRASCFPEIVGDAGRLVEPDDADDLAQALEEILENTSKRNELISRGFRRAQDFQWDATARQTLKVYHEAVRSPPPERTRRPKSL